jgi:VanZ family protein
MKAASWLIVLGLVVVTIVPADERPMTGLQHEFEHFLAFMLASLTFGFAYSVSFSLRALLLSAIVFTLALELSQVLVPTRHARMEDFIIDAVTACVGIVVGYAGRRLIERRS